MLGLVELCREPCSALLGGIELLSVWGQWHTCHLGESGEHIHLRNKCLRGYPLGYHRHTYYKGYPSASLKGTVLWLSAVGAPRFVVLVEGGGAVLVAAVEYGGRCRWIG